MTYICEKCGREHKTQEEVEIEAGIRKEAKYNEGGIIEHQILATIREGNDADSLPAEPLPSSSRRKKKIDAEKHEGTT